MFCVNTAVTIEDIIKKSRFIGLLIPCQSESEALEHLNQFQQKHPNASHIAFAYRIQSASDIIIKFHDDGEPSGTAGKPIFQHIEGKGLINILCVVVRYFGGIKLGAGGLTRAYGNTAKNVIKASSLIEHIEYIEAEVTLEYKQMQNFEYQLEKLDGNIIKQEFSEIINVLIKVPVKNLSNFKKLLKTQSN